MSTQDQITEILNAMDRNPELAEQLRARILGDDLMAEMGEAQNERVQIADLLGTVVELSGSLARFISAVDSRQRKSDDAIAGLQHEQEAVQSAIAHMQADIERMATSQSQMDAAIAQLQTDVEALKSGVSTLKSDMVHVKGHLDEIDERFDKVDERFDKIDERFDKIDKRLDKMDERFDKIDERLDKMDERFDKIEGRLDNTAGANYEFKVQKNLGSIAGQHLRLRRTRTLKGPRTDDDQGLRDWVDEAEDNGVITESENHDMWLLDLIFSGRRRDGGNEVLVAAEVSITAGHDDISRAKERSETLHKATDIETIPVVIAEHIDQERQESAEQAGVFIIPVPEI